MKRYETIIVLDSDTGKETWDEISGKMISQIEEADGLLIKVDDWGSIKLAYEINKKTRGHYYRVEFCAPGSLIKDIERYFRLDEKVIRFLSVLIDENPDMDQLRNGMTPDEAPAETEAPVETETPAETEATDNETEEVEE